MKIADVKDWVVVVGGVVSVIALGVSAFTYWRNGSIERDRWRAHLSVQPFRKDASVTLTEAVAVAEAGLVGVHRAGDPQASSRTPPAPAPPPTRPAPQPGSGGSTDTVHLLVRNLSFRPTGIVKVALRDAQGVEFNAPAYAEKLDLPWPVDPWRSRVLKLVMHGPDYQRADVLVLGDMDDHEVAIPLKEPGSYRKSFDFP
jgi:hypothetical protein